MKNQKQSIRKIVTFLNDPEEEGGFWLPNIQRPFVWSEEQICRLFDSIMRQYPISTLLIWKTKSTLRRRRFIDNWKEGLKLSTFFVPEDDKKKCLVLDGQQRLQALFIGLLGSFEGKELYFDILSGEVAAPDDVKYRFQFLPAKSASFPWIKLKDLVFTTKNTRQLSEEIQAKASTALTPGQLDKVTDHLDLILRTMSGDDVVTYQELDSIDNPALYTDDDVVEVFIRANSGGTKLGKSDLLFSLLSATWDVATEKLEDLLANLNTHGFAFDRDFVLKTCLVVLGHGARYEVEKFRKLGVREEIEAKWDDIAKAIQNVLDFVRGRTFIQCDKALPTYLVLIPLVYVRYHHRDAWDGAKNVETYLLRCSLAGAFGGNSDYLLDALVKKLAEIKGFDAEEAFKVIRSQGRSLELTEDRFWQMGYGSETIHLLFNLWYRDFNYTPAYDNNMPQIDHIFPQSALKKIKLMNPKNDRLDLMKYREGDRNQLANCMLLTREENGAGGKSDTPPGEWFSKASKRDPQYLEKHLIPTDSALWEISRFDDFIIERKKLILQKFKTLIQLQQPPAVPTP